jgi:hypothetical protein
MTAQLAVISEDRAVIEQAKGVLWKRVDLFRSTWVKPLNFMPDREVRRITAAAIELARSDATDAASSARKALRALPGCKTAASHAVASAILTAGAPQRMAVYDKRAVDALDLLHCPSPCEDFGQYMDTVCALAREVNDVRDDLHWFPRDVDQALYVLGGKSDSAL